MSIKSLLAIAVIYLATAVGWFILGNSLMVRTASSGGQMRAVVNDQWGGPMKQAHPELFVEAPDVSGGKRWFAPAVSDVKVALHYEPKQKGLIWNRTYLVDFNASYTLENTSPIDQTVFVLFRFPTAETSYERFSFVLGGVQTTQNPKRGESLVESTRIPAGGRSQLTVSYRSRGTDSWGYSFGEATRIRNFALNMRTDFHEYNFPANTGSATDRQRHKDGWAFTWAYPDVIGAQAIGMDMPNVLNPGPVASRITFFAPVSLLFFFAVVVILVLVRQARLHPMNFFFLAAGYFAFALLFAYLVDHLPLVVAFLLSSAVSLVLVSGYLTLAFGWKFSRWVAAAQFAYMVLFSASFFFDGFSGLTITVGAIATLAILMVTTARIDWSHKFSKSPLPPPIPA